MTLLYFFLKYFVEISTFLTLISYKSVFVIQEREKLLLPHWEFKKRVLLGTFKN